MSAHCTTWLTVHTHTHTQTNTRKHDIISATGHNTPRCLGPGDHGTVCMHVCYGRRGAGGVEGERECVLRGRGLGEPGSILLDENVTCRRGESSAQADGSKANTAIRVMLATMERIIRCFAVFARYLPEVLLCSLFLFAACCCFFCHLVYHHTYTSTPATLNSAGSSNIRCDEHGASFLLSASLRHQSKAKQRKQAPTGCPSPSGGVIPVTSRFLALSLALGKASSQSAWAIDKTTVGPHNIRQPAANIPPTYVQRQQHRPARHHRLLAPRAHTVT